MSGLRTVTPKYADKVKRSREYTVKFNGLEADVLQGSLAAFAHVICEGPVEVEVTYFEEVDAENTVILPKSRNISFTAEGTVIKFTVEKDWDVGLFVNKKIFCDMPLFIFVNRPEEKPDPNDDHVTFFKGGGVYDIGILNVKSGETVYIEEGAVVRGAIHVYDSENVRIMGRGVLDGSCFDKKVRNELSVLMDTCENFEIRDITIIDMSNWIVVLSNSKNGKVKRVREIGSNVNSDGCDICGSSDIVVEELFVTNNDDCIVLKALDDRFKWPRNRAHWNKGIENILVQKCVFLNNGAGQAFEIGHELSTDYIRNVVFRDIDVLAKHKMGPVFGIHNRGYVEISDLTYEDIRVEHCFDRLFDVRIMKPLLDRPGEDIGGLKNILFKDISVDYLPVNDGYTVSLIGGRDEAHQAENVTLQNFKINGKVVKKPEEFELHTKYCKNLRIID